MAAVPPVGRLEPAQPRHHTHPPEAGVGRDLLDFRVVRRQVRRDQPRIARIARHQVADAEIARLDPLLPRHPLRRDQRLRAGQQHDLADRDRRAGAGRRDRHRPAPAQVAGQVRLEQVGGRATGFRLHADMPADRLRAGLLGRGGVRDVDCGGEYRVDRLAGRFDTGNRAVRRGGHGARLCRTASIMSEPGWGLFRSYAV